jgi:hypothetical protein
MNQRAVFEIRDAVNHTPSLKQNPFPEVLLMVLARPKSGPQLRG